MSDSKQIDLFEHVASAYDAAGDLRLTNEDLYREVARRAGIPANQWLAKTPVGRARAPRNVLARACRWHQQTLKGLGLLSRVEGERGVWELTAGGRSRLRTIKAKQLLVAWTTDLGIAFWGYSERMLQGWQEPVDLVFTSPEYPLAVPRAYGNPELGVYVDALCKRMEPVVRLLVCGGSVALNLPNDIFEKGTPARSLYLERLTIALCDRLGLHLMDRLIWQSNKPPGPIQWASKQRVQLNSGYEYVLWFCNSPADCRSDNRRVLETHTAAHSQLIARGGEHKARSNSDGSHQVRLGSYSRPTTGKIPRNVLTIANTCASQRAYKAKAIALGLQPHGAPMPLALARKLVQFLCPPGGLVLDNHLGSGTTALACELEDCRWAGAEPVWDYVRGAMERFRGCDGFETAI